MKANHTYLETVIRGSPAYNWAALFQLRAEVSRLRVKVETVSTKRVFMPSEEVSARLTEIEQGIFEMPTTEVEERLFVLTGHTDLHTTWWKRLRVINGNREILENLAKRSERWTAMIGLIKLVLVAPQASRADARLRVQHKIEPILSTAGTRINERYELTQKYGDKHQIATLASRLLVDAPALFELERSFFETFKPDVSGSLIAVSDSSARAQSAFSPPLAEPPVKRGPLQVALAAILLSGALVVLLSRIF